MRAFLGIQIFGLTSENLCIGPGRCAGDLYSFLVREATHMIDADIIDPGFEYEEYAAWDPQVFVFQRMSWDCMKVRFLSWVLVVGINHLHRFFASRCRCLLIKRCNVKFLPFRVTSTAASAYFCLGLYRKGINSHHLTSVINIYL